ncbi:MAG: TlpA family protein disulfide reductase [Dysgonomonas sp.]
MKKTDVGQEFIDFTIEQPDGTKVSLSDYVGKGKYVLVDFWASWCGPCRGEIPNLRELYKKYKGDKFEIVGVAVIDEIKDTQKAIEEDKVEWPQILDSKEVPMRIYGIRSIPHIMLIGPDGTILARNLRGEDMIARITKELN